MQSKGGDDQKQMRSEYLEMRLVYSKAVRREKRSYQRRMRDRLQQKLKCPKFLEINEEDEYWSEEKNVCDLLEVYDKDGNVKAGEEAVKVWKEHFTKVLGASNDGAVVMKSELVIVRTSITGALTGWTSVRGSVNLFQERRLHGPWIG